MLLFDILQVYVYQVDGLVLLRIAFVFLLNGASCERADAAVHPPRVTTPAENGCIVPKI